MTQKLSATARRDKAARDKAYAMTPARKAKKAHAEREARANPSKEAILRLCVWFLRSCAANLPSRPILVARQS